MIATGGLPVFHRAIVGQVHVEELANGLGRRIERAESGAHRGEL